MIAYRGLDCLKCNGYLVNQANDDEQSAEVAKKWSEEFNAEIKPVHAINPGASGETGLLDT